MTPQQQQQQPQQYQYQEPQQHQPHQQPDPDAYLTNRDWQRLAPEAFSQYVMPQLNSIADMTAQTNLAMVQREFGPAFDKYAPEIHANLAQVQDKRLWTVDNLRKIVKFVQADHVEELAREHAARLVAEMEPTWRSSGAAMAPAVPTEGRPTLQSEVLPSDWKERAARAGLTEQHVEEFCRANEISRDEFFKLFEKTAITEVTRRG